MRYIKMYIVYIRLFVNIRTIERHTLREKIYVIHTLKPVHC